MKVIDKRERATTFKKLVNGDVFAYNSRYYIRVVTAYNINNAFSISEKIMTAFIPECPVEKLEAELVVK